MKSRARNAATNGLPIVVARIDEPQCIGCALCLEACPVDAIIGSGGMMHTVIAAECTGCGWCLPACPVDCIVLEAGAQALTAEDRRQRAVLYRRRHRAHRARREIKPVQDSQLGGEADRRAAVERAVRRARERLEGSD